MKQIQLAHLYKNGKYIAKFTGCEILETKNQVNRASSYKDFLILKKS